MKDRVPGAPGRYKAVITAQEQQKLAAAVPFTITLTRDDDPIIEGTPYNKASVLPDSLAHLLCPGALDPTPADAIRALAEKDLEDAAHPGCWFRVADGVEEYHSAPFVPGESYRTAKRVNGKTVYARLLALGEMPTGTTENPGYRKIDIQVAAENIQGWRVLVRSKTEDGDEVQYKTFGMPYIRPGTMEVAANLYFEEHHVVLESTFTQAVMPNVFLWVESANEVLY